MARKTLQEKKLADQRHGLYNYRFEETQQVVTQTTQVKTLPNTLAQDLRKTVILTFLILLMQLILFMALRNNLLNLPGLNY